MKIAHDEIRGCLVEKLCRVCVSIVRFFIAIRRNIICGTRALVRAYSVRVGPMHLVVRPRVRARAG